MGLLIEIVLRIFISVANQFTKKDLNEFVEQFPKDVGEKIGQAVKGNLNPISNWLSESTSNLKFFVTALSNRNSTKELSAQDEGLEQIESLIKAVLKSIDLIKKPILLKEIFGNINYYSLWLIDGYTNNAYSKTNFEITPNSHFHIYLIEAKNVNYEKILRLISKSQPIPKKILKKSLNIKRIETNQVVTLTNNWFKRKKNISTNFSIDSYLNLLADIEKNIEISSTKTTLWKKFKNLFKF
ncbi:MAG: hypothetical protein ACPGVD_04785 [Flavobacteriales bacterium]